jgi:hypothetical protein
LTFAAAWPIIGKSQATPYMAQIMELVKGTISATSNSNELVMVCSIPMVQGYFSIVDLQRWTTTLEEIIGNKRNAAHQYALEGMCLVFKHMLDKHQEQHEEVISAAPTADDLQSYLAFYSAAVGTIK